MNTKAAMILLLVLLVPARAISGEVSTPSGNLAIWGYDPVAYFTDGKPRQGSRTIAYQWLGAEWHFASEQHKQLFVDDPIGYAPQYGGHCADGMYSGYTIDQIDPDAWRIIDGKLFLFGSREAMWRFLERQDSVRRSKAKWTRLTEKAKEDAN